MAGMLPGVECARRRRIHQNHDSPVSLASGSTRKSSFCLYASNHESFHTSTTFSMQSSTSNREHEDEKLGQVARQAKERLDERLRSQKKSSCKRVVAEGQRMREREILGLKNGRNGAFKSFNCAKFSWN